MAPAHLPKPSLRSPAVAEKNTPAQPPCWRGCQGAKLMIHGTSNPSLLILPKPGGGWPDLREATLGIRSKMNRLGKILKGARMFWERWRVADVGVWRPRICYNQDLSHGPMLTVHQPEEKGNPMESTPIPIYGFSPPGCDGRRLPTNTALGWPPSRNLLRQRLSLWALVNSSANEHPR